MRPEVSHLVMDDRRLDFQPGETIWQCARRHGIEIPHLCLSTAPDFRPDGNCRTCLVEVEGFARLQPACLLEARDGMRVVTASERVLAVRRTVMELLLAEAAVAPDSEAARLAAALGLHGGRFAFGPLPDLVDDSHPGIAVDLSKCIHCMRCVQACREVEVNNVIGMAGRGHTARIVFDFGDPMGQSTCVSCGSCAQACPTGAIAFKAPFDG